MSDDDLIRRGDALAAAKGFVGAETAIAALPAREMVVKPLVWERVDHPTAGPMFLAHCPLTGHHRAFGEQQKQALAQHREACILAVFVSATTDATQTRDAALREAARIAETHGVYPELNVWGGGPAWYRHGREIAAAIRALIGRKPHDQRE